MSKKGAKAKPEAGSTTAQAPSEVEFVSSSLLDTNEFLSSALGWNVKNMPEWKMAVVNWGLKMTGMVRAEMDQDKGRDQRTIFYMTVPDIDKEFKRLIKLGAESFKEPAQVPGMGQWGYVKVPGDIVLGLWANDPSYTPPARIETKKPGAKGTASFFEMISTDLAATSSFFDKAYNWTWGGPFTFVGEPYWYCMGDRTFSVGLRGPRKGEKGANCLAFFSADVLADQTKKSVSQGAKKVGGVIDYNPHGEAQMINAPGKIPLGLWKDNEMSGSHGDPDEKGEEGGAENEKDEENSEEVAEKPAAKGKGNAPAKKAATAKSGGRKAVAKAAPKKTGAKKRAAPAKAGATKKRTRAEAPKASKRPTKRAKKE